MSLLGEIKRRKIFQVAAVYAVVAWLLVQVVATVEAPLSLPDWVDTLVILLLAIGFPITLVISWAFNMTPDGLVRDSNDRATTNAGRGIEYVLIALLGIAVAWLLYRDLGTHGDTVAETAAVAGQPSAEQPAAPTSAERLDTNTAADQGTSAALPNSIAVLLCDNFSTDPDNAFFAASLHEELLNQLVKLSNLNVIARTSVLQYSGVDRPAITRIADELRVGSVIECSVAYGDGRIVISVQLINGDTGLHIWSERYNREFADVFGIQADIAMNVANALAVEFSLEEQQAIERVPTDSPEAYALYLQALSLSNVDFAEGAALLQRALTFDPAFALAHQLKALYHSAVLVNTTGLNATSGAERDEQMRLARLHAARAEELDPSLAGLGATITNLFTWNWAEMLAVLEEAPDPLGQGETWIFSYVGEHETALRRARRRFELDPRNWNSFWGLAVAQHYAGESDEAARLLREATVLAPAVPVLRSWLAYVEISRGNYDAATEELARADQLLTDEIQAVYLPEIAYMYSRMDRMEDRDRIVARIEQAPAIEPGTGGRALIHLARGDRNAAIEELRNAIDKIEAHEIDEGFWNLMNIRMNVTADPLLEEPTFVDLRNRLRGN